MTNGACNCPMPGAIIYTTTLTTPLTPLFTFNQIGEPNGTVPVPFGKKARKGGKDERKTEDGM